jgi:hypothetical protein
MEQCAANCYAREPSFRPKLLQQVTHYYFEGCAYYTPMLSDSFNGTSAFRDIVDISTGREMPNVYAGSRISTRFRSLVDAQAPRLPADFDAERYLAANPDVAAAGMDPRRHYLEFGYREGRPLTP